MNNPVALVMLPNEKKIKRLKVVAFIRSRLRAALKKFRQKEFHRILLVSARRYSPIFVFK
jgi:hypothetical protein